MSVAYAWSNASLICGQCHYTMDCSISKNTFPVEYRARCSNAKCENFGKLFKPKYPMIELEEITDRVAQESL